MVRPPCSRSRLLRCPEILALRSLRGSGRLLPAGSAVGQAAPAHAGKGFRRAGQPGGAQARQGMLLFVDPGSHERDRVVVAEMTSVNDRDHAGSVSGKPVEESSGTGMKAPVLRGENDPVSPFGAAD